MWRSLKIAAPSTDLGCLILLASSVLLLLLKQGSALLKPDCQCYLFQSNGRSSGYFKSPYFPRPYPSNLNCVLYTFVGDIDEIVELTFYEFNMRPGRPRSGNCTDTLRLYLNLHRPEVNEVDPWDEEFCGAFQDLRQTSFYSRDRVTIMYLHTDRLRGVNYQYTGFKGMFTFLRKDQFLTDGIQLSVRHKCVYYFNSTMRKKGKFFSPGYPQNYHDGSSCDYQFEGKPGERILVNFNNIKLDGHPNRCDPATAGDRISAYDGLTTHNSKLAHFCGLRNGPQVVSHGNTLLVHFQSDKDGRTAQGFAADFTFVLKWSVQPTKIIQEPMRGDQTSKAGPEYPTISEPHAPCEEEYESSLQTKSGVFTLPRSPYEPGMVCTFKIKGLPDEIVQLNFENVQLDSADIKKCRSHTGDRIEIFDGMSDAQQWLDVVCGHSKSMHRIFSTGPHLTVKFVSDMKRHPIERGFRATYKFNKKGPVDETSPVTEAERKPVSNCRYRVFSKSDSKGGTFSTPGYPHGYRPGLTCHWFFIGLDYERVLIEFTEFSLNKPAKTSTNSLTAERCKDQDRVKIYKFYYEPAIGQLQRDEEAITYCGDDRPISIMSASKAQLDMSFFASPNSYGYARGLHFRYAFLTNFSVKAPYAEQVYRGECIFRFVSWNYPNGSFTSPNYPGPYPEEVTCEYILQGRSDESILLVFDDFDLDSNSEKCDPDLDDFVIPQPCAMEVGRPMRLNEDQRRLCYRPSFSKKRQIHWRQPCLKLKFFSNKIATRRGFFANYFFIKNAQSLSSWQDQKKDNGALPATVGAPLSLLLTFCTLLVSVVFTRACE